MTRTELADASDLLVDAAAASDDEAASERLAEISTQLDSLADAERGPDHGRLARIQTALGEVQESVSDDVAATIDDALDHVVDYRSTIEGV